MIMQRLGSAAALAVLMALSLGFVGCDDAAEEIELTLAELDAAAQRQDGEAFARGLAPESFQHYERLRKIALDGDIKAIHILPMSERYDILVMRHRSTRKELSKMDGRAWVVHLVNNGWIDRVSPPEDLVDKKKFRVSGNSATMEVIYDVRQPAFTGEGAGDKLSDVMSFQRVDDRWLADARRPSVLFERLIQFARQMALRTPYQLMTDMEQRATGRECDRDIWEKPMR